MRVTQDQMRAMVQSADHIIRAAVVRDRFGEYGLTCVGILERRGRVWHVLGFFLSCRVLGRGVETWFLADLASEVLAQGGDYISAEFNPTGRNAVAADFLERSGFTKTESGLWEHSAAKLVATRQVRHA
jgi:FkbH-like protein